MEYIVVAGAYRANYQCRNLNKNSQAAMKLQRNSKQPHHMMIRTVHSRGVIELEGLKAALFNMVVIFGQPIVNTTSKNCKRFPQLPFGLMNCSRDRISYCQGAMGHTLFAYSVFVLPGHTKQCNVLHIT